jgi:PAS domain S-box-containing protein
MSGTIMDITDRKQYQVTIQQQLGEIEAIYRSAPIGLSLIDTDFKFVRINEQLAQINGLSVSAHIGRTIREVLPEMAETIEPLYQQVIDSGEPILDLEVSGIVDSQPGVERSWLASYYPHKDADNRAIGVNATVQEITNRKRMEMARLAAEQERDRFFNLSLDLLAIGNFEGYFVRLNPAFEQILGFTNSELMAQPLINFVHPDDREHTLTGTRSLTLGDLVMDFENRYLCKNGSYRWVSWNARPYLQSNAWYAIGRDITESKQTKTALEERNQELDSFVHIVAHDLKAPLRGISNLSQWIEDDLEGQLLAANQPQMTLLRSRVRRMEAIVDGLLDYARVGKVAVKIEPVIVAELLAETIDSIAPPPTFKVIIDPNLPTLHTKRLLLFQVFANLIGNGIKHHDRLDGSLHISAAERSDCYEFRITDDGPGIALDYQDKIFKIFQSGNPQNKQDSSGIGLSIVKKIVETEGGSIWLQSQLGQGTTFYFTWQKCSDSDRNW